MEQNQCSVNWMLTDSANIQLNLSVNIVLAGK